MMDPPSITHHAFERAKERLGMSSTTFAEWVRLTSECWTQVNSTFLRNRNLNVAGGLSHYYVNPLTHDRGALFVVRNNVVVTVMDFYELKAPSPPTSIPDNELVQPPIQRTTLLMKLVNRLCEDGIIDNRGFKTFFNMSRLLESEDIKYLVSYAQGQLNHADVIDVLGTKKRFRDKIYLETLEAKGYALPAVEEMQQPPVEMTSEIVFQPAIPVVEGSQDVG